jgi:NAD-dependent deacetylase
LEKDAQIKFKMTIFPGALIEQLRGVQHLAILTGAGTSAESGVPTFRDAQSGLWAQYNPQELATPLAFQTNPQLVWDWYQWRRKLIAQVNPNPGHFALAKMQAIFHQITLITQNVDGLHQRAGSQNVIELHGNILRDKCFDCNAAIKTAPPVTKSTPRCPLCGGLARPDVVWFGEFLDSDNLNLARKAAQNCDVFLSIGTSTVVQPAASLPVIAGKNNAVLVEINTQPTPVTRLATYVLQGPSGEILPQLFDKMVN